MTTPAKYLVITAIVILALAAGAFIYFTSSVTAPGPDNNTVGQNPPVATSTPSVPTTTAATSSTPAPAPKPKPIPTPQPVPIGITMAQVAAHSSAGDCWTVIRGNVYNLTTFISKHPGGSEKILQLCGKDGTNKFVDKHGGSQKQEDVLATFKIGVLAQ